MSNFALAVAGTVLGGWILFEMQAKKKAAACSCDEEPTPTPEGSVSATDEPFDFGKTVGNLVVSTADYVADAFDGLLAGASRCG